MKISNNQWWWILAVMCLVSFTYGMTQAYYEHQAINNGAAYYDPNTGDFTWIERDPVVINKVGSDK